MAKRTNLAILYNTWILIINGPKRTDLKYWSLINAKSEEAQETQASKTNGSAGKRHDGPQGSDQTIPRDEYVWEREASEEVGLVEGRWSGRGVVVYPRSQN